MNEKHELKMLEIAEAQLSSGDPHKKNRRTSTAILIVCFVAINIAFTLRHAGVTSEFVTVCSTAVVGTLFGAAVFTKIMISQSRYVDKYIDVDQIRKRISELKSD